MSKDIPGNRNNKKAILISCIFLMGKQTVLYLCEIPDFGNGTVVVKENILILRKYILKDF